MKHTRTACMHGCGYACSLCVSSLSSLCSVCLRKNVFMCLMFPSPSAPPCPSSSPVPSRLFPSSPIFRAELQGFEDDAEELRVDLRRLLKTMKGYVTHRNVT